jgi:hypothetical protein
MTNRVHVAPVQMDDLVGRLQVPQGIPKK